eukprot:763563-Hanusia_phi.AAC.7
MRRGGWGKEGRKRESKGREEEGEEEVCNQERTHGWKIVRRGTRRPVPRGTRDRKGEKRERSGNIQKMRRKRRRRRRGADQRKDKRAREGKERRKWSDQL